MEEKITKRKFGIGSFSPIISAIGMMWRFTYISSSKPIGAVILNYFGIYGKTNIVSLGLLIISVIVGLKYKNHMGAKFGYKLSIAFLILIAVKVWILFSRQ